MPKSLPPLYALKAFESTARTGSATFAANELGVTQSAVSKHVKTLERYFGCQLFVRNGPRMEVTPQGQIFATELKHGFKRIEDACTLFQSERGILRLKAPSSLTMRWLLDCLGRFRQTAPGFEVQISSVWMDIDTISFFNEPYDCAILLGGGRFGEGTESVGLFGEWLIPVCAPSLIGAGEMILAEQELIHPSPDRRDWRRWLARSGFEEETDLMRGKVFDTLEQGNAAAIAGHGVSVGDLAMCAAAIADGQLTLPFKTAVNTRDGYYLVWPDGSRKLPYIKRLLAFLQDCIPQTHYPDLSYVE